MILHGRIVLLAAAGFLVSCRPAPRPFERVPHDDKTSESDDPSQDPSDEQPERCDDSIDNDQDAAMDCADADCRDAPECVPGAGPLGAPCTLHSDCAALPGNTPLCLPASQGYPGGFCTEQCASWDEQYTPLTCPGDNICAPLRGDTFSCAQVCETDADCSEDYACQLNWFALPQCLPRSTCGDGVRQWPEVCDGNDGVTTCEGGSPTCTPGCTLDTSTCPQPAAPVCGNGIIEGSEGCDGDAPFDAACPEGHVGTRSCLRSVCVLAGDCKAVCGDGLKVVGEVCEPGDTPPSYCGADARCNDTCDDWLNCELPQNDCNDGQRTLLETCDAQIPLPVTCKAFGFASGELACGGDNFCQFDTSACISTCGDGVKSLTEQCDGGDLGGWDCTSLGGTAGELGCLADCTFDVSQCVFPVCGNGVLEIGEACDTTDLNHQTCNSLGYFEGGDLACAANCSFDTSACNSECGDGLKSPNEECDGDRGYAYCPSYLGSPACTENCKIDESTCIESVCGDGVVNLGEQCDGNVAGLGCQQLGFPGGTLSCANCQFDTSTCQPNVCGDGFEAPGECEFSGTRDCAARVASPTTGMLAIGGTMTCREDCTIDNTQCVFPVCGDGILSGAEFCDGAIPSSRTCQDYNYTAGELTCTTDCFLDTSTCHGVCGDGVDSPDEACDPSVPASLDCQAQGYATPGTGSCSADCKTIDLSACTATCGNGVVEPFEQCDGTAPRCSDFGYDAGTASCASDCSVDFSGCSSVCGDGVIRSGEQCEASVPTSYSCQNRGYPAGTATCNGCVADYSGCHGVCGDGVLSPDEFCDPTVAESFTCQRFGYPVGTATCNGCVADYSGCQAVCGDGVVSAGEACDTAVPSTCESWGYSKPGVATCNACTYADLGPCATP